MSHQPNPHADLSDDDSETRADLDRALAMSLEPNPPEVDPPLLPLNRHSMPNQIEPSSNRSNPYRIVYVRPPSPPDVPNPPLDLPNLPDPPRVPNLPAVTPARHVDSVHTAGHVDSVHTAGSSPGDLPSPPDPYRTALAGGGAGGSGSGPPSLPRGSYQEENRRGKRNADRRTKEATMAIFGPESPLFKDTGGFHDLSMSNRVSTVGSILLSSFFLPSSPISSSQVESGRYRSI
jgi:hypothetical protein